MHALIAEGKGLPRGESYQVGACPPFPALSLTAKLFTCIKASQTNAILIMEQIMLMDRSRASFVTRLTPALLETLMPCETTRDPFLRNVSETYNHKSREASLRIKQQVAASHRPNTGKGLLRSFLKRQDSRRQNLKQ